MAESFQKCYVGDHKFQLTLSFELNALIELPPSSSKSPVIEPVVTVVAVIKQQPRNQYYKLLLPVCQRQEWTMLRGYPVSCPPPSPTFSSLEAPIAEMA